VPVPEPAGGDVVDRAAAVRLGKALFWDVQAGSDGRVACATCHYRAGADARRTNALHPGPDGVFTAGGVTGPGQALPDVSFDADDRVGSAGTAAALFVANDPDPTAAADRCTPVDSPPFGSARVVTPRQAPSVLGAVFYRLGFWDGRASDRFNRSDLWGPLTSSGPFVERAALASQAVAPPATFEMSCLGRRLDGPEGLGAKLLARRPLALQQVAPDDAVLGALSATPAPGLSATYADLVAAAFGPDAAAAAEDRFTALWAQAIAAYEATLVPDATPLDRFLAGDQGALSAVEQRGLALFRNKAGCVHCHAGAELTDASATFARLRGLVNEDGGDQGFHNLGVRPTAEDLGRGGSGVMDLPLSESDALADRGAFKTPGLRNVALTGPYFHDGAKATLADVVDFYDRGGDFANAEKAKRMVPLRLTADEKAALVAFLEGALGDPRVACEAAPFDHPALDVVDGPALPATGARGRGCP
jgi:cytochrome c peroxidase